MTTGVDVDPVGHYTRVSSRDSADLWVSRDPGEPHRYRVTGVAYYGESHDDPNPKVGEIEFIEEFRHDMLVYTQSHSGWNYSIIIHFSGDELTVTEENWMKVHGLNVNFQGTYRRSTT